MNRLRLNLILVLFFSMATATFAITFYWDHSQSAHWARAKNWNSNGAGGFPNATSAEAWLVYNNYPNAGGEGVGSGKMDVTVDDNNSNADTFSMKDLLIGTDAADQKWTFDDGTTPGKLIVYEKLIFDLRNGGSATFNVEIELGDNAVDLHGKGNRAVLNGKLMGGTASVLDGTKAYYPLGQSSLFGGGLKLTSSHNDGFLGTIKTGLQKVEITQVNGLRNATIEISNVANSFIYPNNALIGALGGTYNLRLDNNLKVGNNNKTTTYGGQFSQGGTLTKEGTATWTLSGANTHTGRTTINAGEIKLAHVNALQDSEVWINAHNGLNLNGYNAEIAGLGGAGNLALGSSTLTLGGSGDYLHLGVISGTGGITIDLSGSQGFGANNTYSGGVLLLGGTLKSASSGALGASSGDFTIGNATLLADGTHTQSRALKFPFAETLATLSVDSGKTLTWSGLINDSSSGQTIRKMGTGTLEFTNDANTYRANILIEEGVVAPSATALADARIVINTDNGLLISGADKTVGNINGSGNLNLGANLTLGNHTQSASYSGALSQVGAKTLTKIGTGTQTFSGTSTRNGPTFINEGTLNLQNLAGSPIGTGPLTVNSGGTLSGNGIVGLSVTVQSGGTLTTSSSSASLSMDVLNLGGTFDCSLSGGDASSLSVYNLNLTGGTLNLQGTPTQATYVLIICGIRTGTFSSIQNLPAGYKIDYAHNGNNVALVADNTTPVVNNITPTISPASANNVRFTVIFDEPVTGFDSFSDLAIGTTGAATATGATFSSSDNTTFIVTLSGVSGEGSLSLTVVTGNGVNDEAGNNLGSSVTSAAVMLDHTLPTVVITTAESSPTKADSIAYNIAFSEPVSGFVDYSDFYITGTTLAGTDIAATTLVDSGDQQNYTLTLNNISGDGWLQFRLKANQIADLAGNNLAADPFGKGLTIDNTAPVLTLNGADEMILDFGSLWVDPSATADDGSPIIVGGDAVNTSVAAIYSLTYDATDAAGNVATQQLTRTVTVLEDAYTTWAMANGLTNGVSDGPEDNPDGDRWNNRAEYALNGDPLDATTPAAHLSGGLADVNGTNYLTHTFPVLDGTSFSGMFSSVGINDMVVYVVSGTTNLMSLFDQVILEVSPALTNGMPTLDSDWNYRTFRFHESNGIAPVAFIRIKIESDAP